MTSRLATQHASLYRAAARTLLAVLMWAGCAGPENDDASADAADLYEVREQPDSVGTGRYYLGREIAVSLDHSEADWMERPGREVEELPGRLIRVLELSPTDVVADIGAGTGYFTFRLSPEVPRGTVYAVDIDPEMLRLIRQRIEETGIENVQPLLGTEQDPGLPQEAVDLVLIVDAYHEFEYPQEMMVHIREALKPGGRVVLVEYRGEDATLPVDPVHRMTEAQARKEMDAAGLPWEKTLSVLPQQHILVFRKPD